METISRLKQTYMLSCLRIFVRMVNMVSRVIMVTMVSIVSKVMAMFRPWKVVLPGKKVLLVVG